MTGVKPKERKKVYTEIVTLLAKLHQLDVDVFGDVDSLIDIHNSVMMMIAVTTTTFTWHLVLTNIGNGRYSVMPAYSVSCLNVCIIMVIPAL